MAAVNGALFGLLLTVFIGPVFFALMQTSIEKGFKKALLVILGISISDIIYISVIYLGLSKIIDDPDLKTGIGYGGGVILIAFGIYSLARSRRNIPFVARKIEAKGFFRYILKGFMINGVSPFVLVFWIGAMTLATTQYEYKGIQLIIFFVSIIAVVFTTDVIKIYLADKLRRFITPRFFKILNIVVGTALILFGLRMISYSW